MLVEVHASTVTRGDAMGVRSAEYRFTRLFTGIRRPRRTIHGTEFAGRVEEVGAAVTEFRVGDEVFGRGGRRERGVRDRARERRDRPEAGGADRRGGGGDPRRLAPRAQLPAGPGTRCRASASSSTAPRARSERPRCSSSRTTSRPR